MSFLAKESVATKRMVCTDISAIRMKATATECGASLGQTLDGMSFEEVDFTHGLPFPDASFDAICFDAALHHSRNIWKTLADCHRVLRPDGLLLAQREQFLAILSQGYALKRLLRSEEVRAGVSENAYSRAQYEYYLRAAGFAPRFHAISPGLAWKMLAPLNGLLFSKWTIVARRAAAAPAFGA
jgi:ubiquinone/menaquinone biosynthesis C-methylase UbiE